MNYQTMDAWKKMKIQSKPEPPAPSWWSKYRVIIIISVIVVVAIPIIVIVASGSSDDLAETTSRPTSTPRPTALPSFAPTYHPSESPTEFLGDTHTATPSESLGPTHVPSNEPTSTPTVSPSPHPSASPTRHIRRRSHILAASDEIICAIEKHSHQPLCQPKRNNLTFDMPVGQYVQLAVAKVNDGPHQFMVCGLVEYRQTLHCWGGNEVVIDASALGWQRPPSQAYWTRADEISTTDPSTRFSDIVPGGQFIDFCLNRADSADNEGYVYGCAIRAVTNTIVCWGNNAYGVHNIPSLIQETPFRAITCGQRHVCALRSDVAHDSRNIECWGNTPTSNRNIHLVSGLVDPPSVNLRHISAGVDITCGVRSDTDKLQCWPLRTGADSYYGPGGAPPYDVERQSFFEVQCGGEHCCGLLASNHHALCWGKYPNPYPNPHPSKPHLNPPHADYPAVYQPQYQQHIGHGESDVQYIHLDVNDRISCGIRLLDNKIDCWGDAYPAGQSTPWWHATALSQTAFDMAEVLGEPTMDTLAPTSFPTPIPTTAPTIAADLVLSTICSGHGFVCWIDDTRLHCAGALSVPTRLNNVSFVDVQCNNDMACALRNDTSVECSPWTAPMTIHVSTGHTRTVSHFSSIVLAPYGCLVPSCHPLMGLEAGTNELVYDRALSSVQYGDYRHSPFGTHPYVQLLTSPGEYSRLMCGLYHSGTDASTVHCWSIPKYPQFAKNITIHGGRVERIYLTNDRNICYQRQGQFDCAIDLPRQDWFFNYNTFPSSNGGKTLVLSCPRVTRDGWCTGDIYRRHHHAPVHVHAVAFAETHACAILPNSTVHCWGHGEVGAVYRVQNSYNGIQFEKWSTNGCHANNHLQCQQSNPPAWLRLRQITVLGGMSCGVTLQGNLLCWGKLLFPELAPFTITPLKSPGRFLGPAGWSCNDVCKDTTCVVPTRSSHMVWLTASDNSARSDSCGDTCAEAGMVCVPGQSLSAEECQQLVQTLAVTDPAAGALRWQDNHTILNSRREGVITTGAQCLISTYKGIYGHQYDRSHSTTSCTADKGDTQNWELDPYRNVCPCMQSLTQLSVGSIADDETSFKVLQDENCNVGRRYNHNYASSNQLEQYTPRPTMSPTLTPTTTAPTTPWPTASPTAPTAATSPTESPTHTPTTTPTDSPTVEPCVLRLDSSDTGKQGFASETNVLYIESSSALNNNAPWRANLVNCTAWTIQGGGLWIMNVDDIQNLDALAGLSAIHGWSSSGYSLRIESNDLLETTDAVQLQGTLNGAVRIYNNVALTNIRYTLQLLESVQSIELQLNTALCLDQSVRDTLTALAIGTANLQDNLHDPCPTPDNRRMTEAWLSPAAVAPFRPVSTSPSNNLQGQKCVYGEQHHSCSDKSSTARLFCSCQSDEWSPAPETPLPTPAPTPSADHIALVEHGDFEHISFEFCAPCSDTPKLAFRHEREFWGTEYSQYKWTNLCEPHHAPIGAPMGGAPSWDNTCYPFHRYSLLYNPKAATCSNGKWTTGTYYQHGQFNNKDGQYQLTINGTVFVVHHHSAFIGTVECTPDGDFVSKTATEPKYVGYFRPPTYSPTPFPTAAGRL